MRNRLADKAYLVALLALALAASSPPALAAGDVGRVKDSKGSVQIERGGKRMAASVGTGIQPHDTIVTGADGSVGITFSDDSMLSAGPGSVLTIDKYVFDRSTNKGEFESTLSKGTLAAVSGRMVKQTPESMRVRTPAAVMGVRGTEFAVRVGEPAR